MWCSGNLNSLRYTCKQSPKLHHHTGMTTILLMDVFRSFSTVQSYRYYFFSLKLKRKKRVCRKTAQQHRLSKETERRKKSGTNSQSKSLYISITCGYKLLQLYLYANCMQLDYYYFLFRRVCGIFLSVIATVVLSCLVVTMLVDCKAPHSIAHMLRC